MKAFQNETASRIIATGKKKTDETQEVNRIGGCPTGRFMLGAVIGVTVLFGLNWASQGQEVLVPAGSQWRYYDAGNMPNGEGDWRALEFEDAEWNSGPAILGYGDGDEATVINYGEAASNKYITTYFRHAFLVDDPARLSKLELRLLRDDGAVVYLNGAEVLRDNMPPGTISQSTRAVSAVGGTAERAYSYFLIGVEGLIKGRNLLAVEIHQSSPTSSDLAFDLELTADWIPFVVAPLVTGDNVAGSRGEVELAVVVSDPILHASNVLVEFHLRAAGPPAGEEFTFVVLPDSQYYTSASNGGTPDYLVAQTDWIVAHREEKNIVFVSHVGDVVEHGDFGGTNSEWLAAVEGLYRLEDPLTTSLADGIPYGVALGNHDQPNGQSDQGTPQFYDEFFGVGHFAARAYYGGHFGDHNDNHFELFTAGGLKFVVLHLEYASHTNAAVLKWADQILADHRDRRAILVSHSLINTGDPATFSRAGQTIYNALKGHANLFLMLCGHVLGEGRRQDQFEGRTIFTLMADYQGREHGGDGWLRFLEFSPRNNLIQVRTYSPVLDQFETDADSQFTLVYDMSLAGAFLSVGQISASIDEGMCRLVCPDFRSFTAYEWYVSVSDGFRAQTSPVWDFRTGEVGEMESLPVLEVSALDAMAAEVGPCPGRFLISRTGSVSDDLWVNLSLAGSASNALDYVAWEAVLSFPAGTNSMVLNLVPLEDGIGEGYETVAITLREGEGYVIGAATTAVMIVADAQTDSDQDGSSDGAEFMAGTDPWDPLSLLKISLQVTATGDLELVWSSVPGRFYQVCFKDDLGTPEWTPWGGDIVASSWDTRCFLPAPHAVPRRFFMVRVIRY